MDKKNLTIRLDEKTIKNAKIQAIINNTTLSAVVTAFLIDYAKSDKKGNKS